MTVVDPGPGFGPATAQPAATKSASLSWAARAGRPPTAATAAASRVTVTSTVPRPAGCLVDGDLGVDLATGE